MDNSIVKAAYIEFGRNGYKKTSIADIAERAGVNKSAVFYHFGSKKELYLFLANHAAALMHERFKECDIFSYTNFFQRLHALSVAKLGVLKEYTGMLDFLMSVLEETDENVAAELADYTQKQRDGAVDLFFTGLDLAVFKDDVPPRLLFTFLGWASEGLTRNIPENASPSEIDEAAKGFYAMLDILSKYLTK